MNLAYQNSIMAAAMAAVIIGIGAMLTAHADDSISISAPALFENRAMLIINGERKILRAGETGPQGVQLISSNSKQAVVKIGDTERVIKLGSKISGSYAKAGKRSISLHQGHGGHFTATGIINGFEVEFLVDTGATHVVINRPTAERIGLKYREGTPGKTNTASGVADVYVLNLDKLRIGDIEAKNVIVSVHLDQFPGIALLGNSFLSKMNISRKGEILTISEP